MNETLVQMDGTIVMATSEESNILRTNARNQNSDLICFSHLRWNFVYQRPQHLMGRFAMITRTFFIEEPIITTENKEKYETRRIEENLWVITPYIPQEITTEKFAAKMNMMLKEILVKHSIEKYIFWYYTPMSLSFTSGFSPQMIVYDCMDELSAFKFAPERLGKLEEELLQKADIVFTGGNSLYEQKKKHHHNIFPFPSSIDKQHFQAARHITDDQPDQEKIPHPRFGFFGVIDERFDIELLLSVSQKKPDWHFIIIGPVVKIDPVILPQGKNIHYLGMKTYDQLPFYISQWDVALILFARNESTRFISPTKTPEYLAAGKPVISTSIKDVVDMYGNNNLVNIADTTDDFIEAAKRIFGENKTSWLSEVDVFLSGISWDKTWTSMLQLMNIVLENKSIESENKKKEAHV